MSDKLPDHEQPTQRRSIAHRRPPAERIPQLSLKPDQVPTQHSRRPPEPMETQVSPPTLPQQVVLPRDSGLYVPWWGFLVVILAVTGITCGMWYMVLANRGTGMGSLGETPTPIFVVITNTPTLGPADESQPSPDQPEPTAVSDESTQTPQAELATATPPPEPRIPIELGSQVVVVGTEGFGLRVRQGPGLDYDMVFLGNDGELFVVQDGPRESDGYTWWYIVDPDNRDRFGWAVRDFLEVVQR